MPDDPGQDVAPGQATDGVTFESFSGLRNTVNPERLGPRELARAVNIDIDDAGQIRRRRGQKLVGGGGYRSIIGTDYLGVFRMFAVRGTELVELYQDYTSLSLLAGMPQDKLAWVQVAGTLYFSSANVSGQISLTTLAVTPWGGRSAHSYYPSTVPVIGRDFWLSPVLDPDVNNPAVAGRLLGPPPMGCFLAYYNGRIYIADGYTLWATELYLYNYVDKTASYRQFEDLITGIAAVEDGLYVGTKSGLYFMGGTFKEPKRTLKERSGVIPGTMIVVPGELVDPEARRRPDVPHQVTTAISCMTDAGLVVGLAGGTVYNLTRNDFQFPKASAGVSMLRASGGFHSIVSVLDSQGTPSTSDAAFGDYVSATLIRNGVTIP